MSSFRFIHRASLPLLAILIALPGRPAAQSVKALVDSQDYVFQVRTIQPMRGPVRNASTVYSLQVTKSRIISDLPYFGRAYIAPADPTKGTLQFVLNHFGYEAKPAKKEGWNVVIRPRDKTDIQELQLYISSAGYASLQVISTNRDAISFTGVITAPDKR